MNGKKISVIIFAFVLVLVLGACNQTGEETEGTEETEETEESSQVTYESHVEGIIEQSCISCHGGDSPSLMEFKEDPDTYIAQSQGPRLDNYEDLVVLVNGDDAGALMRRLDDGSNTEDGEPGNMYVNLGSTEEERQEELAIIKEWVGSWSLKRSDELTEEERAEITAVRE
ncbi:hypothetical protein [Planococcus sp. ISL-109]|uniref:hypothetical protein n=1 Tax=Planococcus sp. ISL-109 TaxID=2819166 RepID=UPI001BE513E4|nr:hypothetical protein [Planococcus sp. ISL-109]MBT2582242.1 hypothetical protein [Planococcus sp. ISL-109]